MSTAGSADSHTSSYDAQVAPAAGGGIDPQLVQQTKNEIRQLVHEINQLAQSDIAPDQFYEGFLQRVVQALASHGGAFWTITDEGQFKLEYQVNMPRAEVLDDADRRNQHTLLLKNVLDSGQPTLVPPRSGSADGDVAANPSDLLLILGLVRVEQQTRGIVEIFQRPGGGPTTQRGYLRFLVQMSELAGEYLRNRRLRHLGDRQALWEHLEQFLEAVHRGLDVRETAYTVVNEGRRLIGCDRVSVTVRRGAREEVLAVSGLDTLDRRAGQVRHLAQLAAAVNRAGQPLWYTGCATPLAPQIETPLQAYLDEAHATVVAVIPLAAVDQQADSADGARGARSKRPIGALIVEQLEESGFHDGLQDRVETVARHSFTALSNALEHQSVFLMPLWRALGKSRWFLQAQALPKALLVLLLVAALLLSLVLVPADFELAARGKLQPAVRRDVFAQSDGIIIEVPVQHEQFVRRGDVLARLSNNALEVEIANLIGRKRAIQERIRSAKRAQLNGRLRVEEQNRLDGELLELTQIELGIDRELELQRQKEDDLIVRSSMDGQIVTWNVRETLLRRPVQVGQALMTVVDPSREWELELYMPEDGMGYVSQALRELDASATDGLPVTFVLASHPDRRFQGTVRQVDLAAEVHGQEGNSVRLRVAVDKRVLPELRSGTTVTAKVHCGRRCIGFVVFHDLIETVQKNILFWF